MEPTQLDLTFNLTNCKAQDVIEYWTINMWQLFSLVEQPISLQILSR